MTNNINAMIEAFNKVHNFGWMFKKFDKCDEVEKVHFIRQAEWESSWQAACAHTRAEVIEALNDVLASEVMSKHVNTAECHAARNVISHCISIIESLSQPKGKV